MSPFETAAAAARALSANRFRSALTVLSITAGTFAIVLMSSLAQGGLQTLRKGTEDLGGARILLVVARKPVRSEAKASVFREGFRIGDAQLLAEGVPHVVEHATFSTLARVDATTEQGSVVRTDFVAADAAFVDAFRMPVESGRTFDRDEDHAHANVCLVGHKTATRLWPDGSPVGRRLAAGPLRCRVIGVLADPQRFGIDFGFDWTDLVLAPLETVADVEPKVRTESALVFKTDGPESNDAAKRILNARLVQVRHGIDDFTIYDFASMMEKFDAVFTTMEIIVGMLAGIALLVGGVGIMTMTMVGVTERTREIGLRRALGARADDVAQQFLFEAVMLSGLGGTTGVIFGGIVAGLASMLIKRSVATWQGGISGVAALVALGVAFGLGSAFGWAPARRAAALDPVAALRG